MSRYHANNPMSPQTREHAAIEYGRHERLHYNLAEWRTPSPRCKIGIWLVISAALWLPIIAVALFFLA